MKVSAKEQAKEHTMAIMWLGIPMVVVVAIGALYTCFAWYGFKVIVQYSTRTHAACVRT